MKKYTFDRFLGAYSKVTNSGVAKIRVVRHTDDTQVAPLLMGTARAGCSEVQDQQDNSLSERGVPGYVYAI